MPRGNPKRWRKTGRGSAFKETDKGVLFLEFRPHRVLALRPDPARAWEKQRSLPIWRGTRSVDLDVAELAREVRFEEKVERLQLTGPVNGCNMQPFHRRRRSNFRKFLEHVPSEVEQLLTDRWVGETWSWLRLLLTSEHAREMAASSDANLAFAYAQAHGFVANAPRDTLAFARRWLRRPRKEAIGRLGFPATKSALKILRKLERRHVSAHVLTQLRDSMLHEPLRKTLAHSPTITMSLLHALSLRALPHMEGSLIDELRADRHNQLWQVGRLLLDTLELGEVLYPGRFLRFGSAADVRFVHDRLVKKARALKLGSGLPFPPPPAELTEEEQAWVEPLADSAALTQEGKTMHHCLGTLPGHHHLALRGRFYAWRILGPERLTVALQRPHDRWELYDLAGAFNAPPSDAMVAWADSLVARANRATKSRAA